MDKPLENILPCKRTSLRIMKGKLPILVKKLEKMEFLVALDSIHRQD